MNPSLLGTTLDGEIVLLEPNQARLYHLDDWAEQVWNGCDGRDAPALAAALAAPMERVTGTLRSLADAGLVQRQDGGWVRLPVQWV